MIDILSVCECSLSSQYTNTNRRWERCNLNCCNQIHLNCLYTESVGMLKHYSYVLTPEPPGETFTTKYLLIARLPSLNQVDHLCDAKRLTLSTLYIREEVNEVISTGTRISQSLITGRPIFDNSWN